MERGILLLVGFITAESFTCQKKVNIGRQNVDVVIRRDLRQFQWGAIYLLSKFPNDYFQ